MYSTNKLSTYSGAIFAFGMLACYVNNYLSETFNFLHYRSPLIIAITIISAIVVFSLRNKVVGKVILIATIAFFSFNGYDCVKHLCDFILFLFITKSVFKIAKIS